MENTGVFGINTNSFGSASHIAFNNSPEEVKVKRPEDNPACANSIAARLASGNVNC